MLAAFLYQDNFETIEEQENSENYEELIENNFDLSDISFPIPFEQIQKFLEKNQHLNLNINIYTIRNEEIQIVYSNITSKENPGSKNVNLLALFPQSECSDNVLQNAHFVLINRLDALFSAKDDSNKLRYHRMCRMCHMKFSKRDSEKFKNHNQFCTNVHNQIQGWQFTYFFE